MPTKSKSNSRISSTVSLALSADQDQFTDESVDGTSVYYEESGGRDEIKEVEKSSRKDTASVRFWRAATTLVLLMTAFAVTFTTYKMLKAEEWETFETAFDQFSGTIADAAIDHQVALREGMLSLATTISLDAKKTNSTWPFVTVQDFEYYARHIRKQTRTEFVSYFTKVKGSQFEEFTAYANQHAKEWVEEGHMQQMGSLVRLQDPSGNHTYHPFISKLAFEQGKMKFVPEAPGQDEYIPIWQFSPSPVTYALVNWNGFSNPELYGMGKAQEILRTEAVFSPVRPYFSVPLTISEEEHQAYHSQLQESSHLNPHTFLGFPVLKDVGDPNSEIVAYLAAGQAWDVALLNLLPASVTGIYAVVKNTCNQSFTWEIRGQDPIYLGEGDLHQHTPMYDDMEVFVDLALHTNPKFTTTPGHCRYSMHVYPSDTFKSAYDSNTPEIFATVVAITFVVVALVFFTYDVFVQKRNTNLTFKAAQSSSIVTSLVPEHLRSRLEEQASRPVALRKSLKNYLSNGDMSNSSDDNTSSTHKPLADLFLNTTILFADISGFTAWSSSREPSQVFQLLESTYQVFDRLAKKHRIFKVETVGDCYVAVAGLPEPRADHALAAARFARAILGKFNLHTRTLEKKLGPDTCDLKLRIGLHSGPVTAGVLRGERARFQLFGDTYQVCSRIEGSGKPGRIHCSKETADLIRDAGKEGWLEKRPDGVTIHGRGTLETYWVTVERERAESMTSVASDSELMACSSYGPTIPGLDEKTRRLVDWNVEMLLSIMRQILAYRGSRDNRLQRRFSSVSLHSEDSDSESNSNTTPLDEVKEIIRLPEFNVKSSLARMDPSAVEIAPNVVAQLHHLVSKIATMYHNNPFHNFDHASHVVQSVTKLMSRIVEPAHLLEGSDDGSSQFAATLHDHSFGITSDPLTQFACAFSALIHDVDHYGVSNAQLVKEHDPLAQKYQRSVAEQNSLDLSWNLLMQDNYAQLRSFLLPNPNDLTRFRQLVVNSVMATDIVDKDLKNLRNARWDKAFQKGDSVHHVDASPRDEVNRKATIVIEHIIQASDISHTMQHWHVYRKWNQNLFEELYVAYLNGRMEKDPAEFWYRGEFGFFDFYIIPLTRKLKECGVFGVSSDEYLNYALKNRAEWEVRGEEVVASMIAECHQKYGVKKDPETPEQAPPELAYPPPAVKPFKVVEC